MKNQEDLLSRSGPLSSPQGNVVLTKGNIQQRTSEELDIISVGQDPGAE